jgi:hypothetical protein
MTFHKDVVRTVVTADSVTEGAIKSGVWGYFANDLDAISRAVSEEKTSTRCRYGQLTKVLGADKKARFVLDEGNEIYSLFYPTDSHLNTMRY